MPHEGEGEGERGRGRRRGRGSLTVLTMSLQTSAEPCRQSWQSLTFPKLKDDWPAWQAGKASPAIRNASAADTAWLLFR